MGDTPGEDQPSTRGAAARRGRRRTIVSSVLLVVMVVFVTAALVENWTAVRSDLAEIGWGTMGAALLVGAAALCVSAAIWRRVLTSMGHGLSPHDSATVFFAGQLGKYVPGAVWPAVIQAELGRAHGVPRSTMTASYVVAFAAIIGSGALVGLLTLTGEVPAGVPAVVAIGSVAGLAGAVLVLHPRGLVRFGGRLWERLGRRLPPIHLTTRAGLEAAAGSLSVWALLGFHCWLLARSLGADGGDLVPITGAFAIAFVSGLIVVPLPAGAGVREGVLVLVLGGTIGRQSGLSVAVASRLALLLAEIALALAAGVPHSVRWAMARRRDRQDGAQREAGAVASPTSESR